MHTLWLRVYRFFIEAVDAVDNGVNRFDVDATPKYEQNTCLPSRVGFLNPPWNVPHTNDDLDRQFAKAMALTGREFEDALSYSAESWLPGRALVEEAIRAAPDVHSSGALLCEGLPAVCAALDFLQRHAGRCRCLREVCVLSAPPCAHCCVLQLAQQPACPGSAHLLPLSSSLDVRMRTMTFCHSLQLSKSQLCAVAAQYA